MITVRGRCQERDGRIHTDSECKLVTALRYFNETWEAAGGRLRRLRKPDDLQDMIAEVPPDSGTLIAFRRSDKSFHGHEPFVGVRRYVMINWMASSFAARRELLRHKISAVAKRVPRAGCHGVGSTEMSDSGAIAATFLACLDRCKAETYPYRHWLLDGHPAGRHLRRDRCPAPPTPPHRRHARQARDPQ